MEMIISNMKAIRNQLCEEHVNRAELEFHIDSLLNHMDKNDIDEFLYHRYGSDYDDISNQRWTHRLETVDNVPANLLFCANYLSYLHYVSVAKRFDSCLSKLPVACNLINDITYFVNRHYIGDMSTRGYIELLAAVCKEINYDGPHGSVILQVGTNYRKYMSQEFQSREALMDRYTAGGSEDVKKLQHRLMDTVTKRISDLIHANFEFDFDIFASAHDSKASDGSISIMIEAAAPFNRESFASLFEQKGVLVGPYHAPIAISNFFTKNSEQRIFLTFTDFTVLFQD